MEYDKMRGCTRSSSSKAPMQSQTGNTGKAIGETGKSSPKGNSRTKVPADRYK